MSNVDPGALSGVRIVEFDAIGSLPLAAMALADMGADIVRIARPAGAAAWDDVGGSVLHRGRQTIELDLKTQASAALRLVTRADIVLEGMRPGVMERLGLGPDVCLRHNPRLVYGRVTGWGQNGPSARMAGHDINYIGITGALHAMGSADQPPPVPLNLAGDYGAGAMLLLTGVLAALVHARATGQGQVVDAAIVDGIALQSAMFRAFMASGGWQNRRGANLLDGAAPFYRCYACADGRFLAVGALEPAFYRLFIEGLGLDPTDWPQHDRARWPAMAERFATIIAARTRDEWAALFDGGDACVTPVLDWDESVSHPHVAARATFHMKEGVVHPAPAPRFSATPGGIRAASQASVEAAISRWEADERAEEPGQ